MIFSPTVTLPPIVNGAIPALYPISAIVKFFSLFLYPSIIEKIILSLELFLPAVFIHRLAKKVFKERGEGWAIIAGLFYSFNSWTYERWLSGQWLVMFGYALFPLAVLWLWEAFERADWKNILKFAILIAIYPIVSLHFAYFMVGFSIVFAAMWWIVKRKHISRTSFQRFVKALGVVILIALAVNSFWLIGFTRGGSPYAGISEQDFKAFQTQADPTLGPWFNVLSLYGFWNQDYNLPKDALPVWWVAMIVFLAFAAFGTYQGFKKKQPLLIAAALIFIPSWILAVGYASGFSMHIVDWAAAVIPGFKGLRETEKFAGLMAFSYALLIAEGGAMLAELLGRSKMATRSLYALAAVFIAAAVYDMPLAFGGQVVTSPYPASWYQVNQITSADPQSAIMVFPWEEYIDLSFANYHMVTDPAGQFFTNPTIVSSDTGNVNLDNMLSTPQEKYIFNIVQGIENVDDPASLSYLQSQHVGYILLLKESDWQRYSFLQQNKHLVQVLESPELTLWKVQY